MAISQFTSLFRAGDWFRSGASAPKARTNMQTAAQWSEQGRSMRPGRRGITRMLGMTGLLLSLLFILSIVIPT